eukprot:1791893-Pleurochrysis_carterae.AAC.1
MPQLPDKTAPTLPNRSAGSTPSDPPVKNEILPNLFEKARDCSEARQEARCPRERSGASTRAGVVACMAHEQGERGARAAVWGWGRCRRGRLGQGEVLGASLKSLLPTLIGGRLDCIAV